MNLETLIDQWIDGNDINIFDSNIMAQGYVDCKKDLKSRKQELIEGIEKLQEKNIIKFLEDRGYKVIKELTGK